MSTDEAGGTAGWDHRRQEAFDHTGPAEILVEIDAGRVEVALAEPEAALGGDGVVVEVEALEDGGSVWGQGVTNLVDAASALDRRFGLGLGGLPGWGDRVGESDEDRVERALEAVEISGEGGRLVVRRPEDVVLRTVPLAVTVYAPDSSSVDVRAGAAPVEVTGRAGAVQVRSTGGIRVAETTGRSSVRCGAGDVSVGRVGASLRVKGGAGDVTVREVAGPTEVVTGSGSVVVGTVAADLAVRCGAGSVTVRDATAGELDLTTGAGSVRVGVHAGVDAAVDLRSAAGTSVSDLPVSRERPTTVTSGAPLRIRGRAAAGSTRVERAAAS